MTDVLEGLDLLKESVTVTEQVLGLVGDATVVRAKRALTEIRLVSNDDYNAPAEL